MNLAIQYPMHIGDTTIDFTTGKILTDLDNDEQPCDDVTHKLRADIAYIVSEMFRWYQRPTGLWNGALRRIPVHQIEHTLLRSGLLPKMMAAYPHSFYDRLVAIVETGSPSDQIPMRRKLLDTLLVKAVSDGSYDPRWVPEDKYRRSLVLREKLMELLIPYTKQRRSLEISCWLAAYLLDCSERAEHGEFSRSTRQVVEDSDGRIANPEAASQYLSRIVRGYTQSNEALPLFDMVNRGKVKGRQASKFKLNPRMRYLLEWV